MKTLADILSKIKETTLAINEAEREIDALLEHMHDRPGGPADANEADDVKTEIEYLGARIENLRTTLYELELEEEAESNKH
jgi:hypothetical protein